MIVSAGVACITYADTVKIPQYNKVSQYKLCEHRVVFAFCVVWMNGQDAKRHCA
jgi:hypothetical protein